MLRLFSARERATTWRILWLWLAEAEKELGLSQISDKAIEAIRANVVVSDQAFKAIAEEVSGIYTLRKKRRPTF